jgi:hypothetical protein
MLILGQIILAAIPFSLFFLVRHETGSDMAGWFALLLSAFGWYMPAHAVNWGKYPALMSMGMMPFVLSLAYLLYRNKDLSHGKRRLLVVLLFASILLSVLTHSRSSIVLGIVLPRWIIVTWLEKRSQRWMLAAFIPVVIADDRPGAFILRTEHP